MYDWRQLTPEERQRVLTQRKQDKRPWHSPPHFKYEGEQQYFITAACYEHQHIIGQSSERMNECEEAVIKLCRKFCLDLYAWCILPNHYHSLVRTEHIEELRHALGQFHGRSSYQWNGEDNQRGRKVWHNCFERRIKSERHFWATLNYIHNNPVHHGYVTSWQDWPWSSAQSFLEKVGREKAIEIWRDYPVLDYGKKWDK
jgi:putative transposase